MIKKIMRILLCVVSFFGFSLIVLKSVTEFPIDYVFNSIATAGTGINTASLANSNYQASLLKQTLPLPHTYINLPKTDEPPLALSVYDSIPLETEAETGQDSPAETTPPSDEPVTPDDEPITDNSFPVIGLDMSENQTADSLLYKNESKYTPDINALANAEYPLKYTKTVSTNSEIQPLVLIVHTHGTECYLPDGANTYTSDTPTRLQDTEQNVVAAGRVLAETLNNNGVPTIHCEIMFDAESYSDSYDLSENAIEDYLNQYPSIQYIFDVHRDSIIRNNNEKVKPVTEINGLPTAQAMFVVGTDSSGANHPGWLDNLTVASIFQSKLIESYGNIMRPINLRAASFNAEHAPGSILIEIGTCGNTVSEAKNCASFLGETIAKIILNDGKV